MARQDIDIQWVTIKCVRCKEYFDTVVNRKVPDVCIECFQCCVPVACAQCGKTFGAVDPKKHRHTSTVSCTCTNCIYQRNMTALTK